MVTVKLGERDTLEKALRKFKKKVDDEGILKEFRDRRYYVKPSALRREKNKEARRKAHLKNKLDNKLLEKDSR